jgi:electron transfer flavoprotein alpha subunit
VSSAVTGIPDEPLPGALAVVVVRDGALPLGADETVAEAGGTVLLVGRGVRAAADGLPAARTVWLAETPAVLPGALARALAAVLAPVHAVLLPGSPDGRDLAPRLAAELDRPLLAGAVSVVATGADVLCEDGRALVELTVQGPFVATLEPSVRGSEPWPGHSRRVEIDLPTAELQTKPESGPGPVADAVLLDLLPPDPRTADLREAPRILGMGGGLAGSRSEGRRAVDTLQRIGAVLGASVGATRFATDAGWLGQDRQIGTTGVVADPELYLAFGVSGAAHHTGGLGRPRHVVSVNTDPSCPMTAMADLGVVADAPAVLAELERRLLGRQSPDPQRDAAHPQPEDTHA